MPMIVTDNIKVYISYPDFVYQNELRGVFKYYSEVINLLDVYLSCSKMERWCEDFLYITVVFCNCEFTIERSFQSKNESTYRYIQRDKNKKIILDIDNISKTEIFGKIKNFI